MRVVGEKVSSELQKADRLAQRGNGTVQADLPRFEQSYRLTIEEPDGDGNGEITVNSGTVRVTVGYSVQSDIDLDDGEYRAPSGGQIVMDYGNAAGDSEIEIGG